MIFKSSRTPFEALVKGDFVADKLEGWVWETYERTGWRQTCYRRGVQVILAPDWSHAADTELSLVRWDTSET